MNWYIPSIVPAPEGWLRNGSADPGDEFYYTSTANDAEVYPGELAPGDKGGFDEQSGWVLHLYTTHEQHHSNLEQYIGGFPTPTAAFQRYTEMKGR